MSARAHAQIRRSQAITTWGPGALIDLPRHSGIVGGLETWPKVDVLDEIADPRLTRKISLLTGVPGPRLYAPPAASTAPGEPTRGIGVWRFPEWMLVQEEAAGDGTSALAGSCTASHSMRRAGSTAARSCRPALSGRVRAATSQTSTGTGSSTARRMRASGSCGSTSAAPAATSPTSWCVASAASRGAWPRRPSSS